MNEQELKELVEKLERGEATPKEKLVVMKELNKALEILNNALRAVSAATLNTGGEKVS